MAVWPFADMIVTKARHHRNGRGRRAREHNACRPTGFAHVSANLRYTPCRCLDRPECAGRGFARLAAAAEEFTHPVTLPPASLAQFDAGLSVAL